MKTIIACTDFSSSATNAVQYAAALAAATKAKLVLFRYFEYPVAATDLPLPKSIPRLSGRRWPQNLSTNSRTLKRS